jgi:Mn-dependent DtxR family transcriptional regulator
VGGELRLTQQHIADFLGTRRVSVTQAAGKLQADQLIKYVRGRVTLVDKKRLEQRSCVCTAIIRRAFAAVSADRDN